MTSTDANYTRRLQRLSGRRWKRLVPNPYRWNVRRLAKGRVLDIGCGIGRCLDFVRPRGVGVDPNETAVAVCREKGHRAYRPEEFAAAYPPPESGRQFDTLLCSHVLEHLDEPTGVDLIRSYLPSLGVGGRVILNTPQERGQRSDPTHVRLMDDRALAELAGKCGLVVERVSSFPLPRAFGRWFVYNETVTIARVSTANES
ncbi:MAG: class I SAM-dependent methyltransferase [Actinomycetota bacterium]|nr:class I SAM-dependent methyltransferase [Actinomycetota bacterium]